MRVVIVADGDVDAARLRHAAAVEGTLVVAADGGALKAEAAGLLPDLVMGDGDSLGAADRKRLAAKGVEVRLVAPEKDETDTELCLREAIARGATEIQMFGAIGGPRPEHGFANISLLGMPALDGIPTVIRHERSCIRLISAPDGEVETTIEGEPGDLVSLLPVGDGVASITTDGLRYPLSDEPLPFGPARGISNELIGRRASVRLHGGRLLIVHTQREGTA